MLTINYKEKMKTSLPNTKSSKGFTLIELLVVVAIIAILATIGVGVFSSAQAAARDGKRKAEINSIGKNIEAGKNLTASSQLYSYNLSSFNSDFPQNAPSDTLYCISSSTSSTTPPTAPAGTYAACPTMTGATANETFTTSYTSGALNGGNVRSWTLCANLERGNPFCMSSLTR